jgi:protein TonB
MIKSSGYSMFDHAALQAVSKWEFVPAEMGNKPIQSWVDVPISFRLKKE